MDVRRCRRRSSSVKVVRKKIHCLKFVAYATILRHIFSGGEVLFFLALRSEDTSVDNFGLINPIKTQVNAHFSKLRRSIMGVFRFPGE